MKQFPKNLQEEISCYLHFNVIKNCPLFESAEEGCLWSLATSMIRLHHLPNNIIIRQGAIVNSIYFINRGRLDVCRNGAVVGTLGKYYQLLLYALYALYANTFLQHIAATCTTLQHKV
jgi:potassium voltage-gated channel Eag-related subfamily H protein 8